MTKSVYVLAPQALVGKSAVALGAIESLAQAGRRVGVFRPIIRTVGRDTTVETLLETTETGQGYDQAYGVTYAEVRQDADAATTRIIERFEAARAGFDVMVILGSDYTDVIGPIEFALNAQIAANLNSPVVLVVSGRGDSPADVRHNVDFCLREITQHCVTALGVVAIGLDATALDDYNRALLSIDLPIVMALPGVVSSQAAMPVGFAATVAQASSRIRTPLMFEHELMKQARSDRRTIVLPESDEDRILRAADILLGRDIVHLVLLGDRGAITARADQLGLDLSRAKVVDPTDPELVERFAQEYARLRAHKGVTVDQARHTVTDSAYFATMMVHLGLADGMVSGAIHTTAHTIRPSLEFIKTKPGVAIVSGYFLMCLPDRVLVFADCAVNTNPSAQNLADIAFASAQTAASFGIEPRVALLSYSTGDSGSGPDVDLVAQATAILRQRDPELPVEGPIQFDAAVDPVVARTKLPGSPVAGHATVFIFPDLNTGNTTYKAVQRTANALAIGPILQGLRKPVNDLSRGALVNDIVNTIAITAIQAQADPAAPF
jgi:phosphate acetyltransferase